MLDLKKHQGPIGQRNRIAFAFMELARDNNFRSLPAAGKLEVIERAQSIGDATAVAIKERYNLTDPRRIAEQLGLKVYGESRGVGGKKILRSAYNPERNEIVIFRDTLEGLLAAVGSKDLQDHLLRFLVGFELFHYLERVEVGNVAEKLALPPRQIGFLKLSRTIPKLSDVAARAFTQTLLGLDFSPLVFDYLVYALYADLK